MTFDMGANLSGGLIEGGAKSRIYGTVEVAFLMIWSANSGRCYF